MQNKKTKLNNVNVSAKFQQILYQLFNASLFVVFLSIFGWFVYNFNTVASMPRRDLQWLTTKDYKALELNFNT